MNVVWRENDFSVIPSSSRGWAPQRRNSA